MFSGPGADDSYIDTRSDYQKNEVAVDYNAGFQGELQLSATELASMSKALRCESGTHQDNPWSAGAVAFLAASTDTMQDCQARGEVTRPIRAATNNS